MQTPASSAYIDAPRSNGERATAARALAFRLGAELLGSSSGEPPESPPPLYRLAPHLGLGHAPREEPNNAGRTLRQEQHTDHRPTEPRRYIALGREDVKRMQRLAHMLATLAGELNLLLAGVQHENEAVEW